MANTGNTQQIIDYGATANDGTGDPLRTAFIKTDENFSNIWLAGPVGSNITIANNAIQSNNTNGNITIKPNGTGIIQANAHIIPNIDGVRDLGSANLSWRRAYIDTVTAMDLDASGDVTVQGNLTVEGDTIQIGNIVTDTLTIQLANTAGNKSAANGAGITVGANDAIATYLFNSSSNVWTTNIGVSATGNVTATYFLGNGSQLTGIVSSYGNANVQALGEAGWTGNIIPAANAAYSLGNATNYWSNLWVANNTIYIGGVPLGITAGNVLTVNGNAVLSNNSATAITTTGNITANYFLGNGSLLTGITSTGNFVFANNQASVSNEPMVFRATGAGSDIDMEAADAVFIEALAGEVDIRSADETFITTGSGGNIWTFGATGILTFPGTPRIDTNSNNFEVQAAENINLEANGVVNIYTDTSGTTYQWQFGNDGNFILPTNRSIIVDGGDGVIGPVSDDMVISWDNEEIRLVSVAGSIEMQADAAFRVQTNYNSGTSTYTSRWEFNQDELVNITGPSAIVTEAGDLNLQGGRDTLSSGNVTITAINNGVAINTWTFANDGNLTLPGNITGADVVSANTFVSNAFNVVTAGNLSITSQYGLGFTGTILEDNGTLELIGSGGGGVVVGWDSTYGNGLGNIATVNFNEVGGEGILLRTGNRAATEYNWNFDSTGNLTLPGNITGNTGGFAIGYRDIPQVTFSANATAALTDAGKHYYSTTAGNLQLTLPDNVSVAIPTGATLTIVVNAAGNVLVGQGTGVTLYQAGSATTGNRVVGAYGLATVMKVAANTWVISGTGVY